MLVISRDGIKGSFAFKVLSANKIKIKNQSSNQHYLRLELEEVGDNNAYEQILINISEDSNTYGKEVIDALIRCTDDKETITVSDNVARSYLKVNSVQNPFNFTGVSITGYLINMPKYLALDNDTKLHADEILS